MHSFDFLSKSPNLFIFQKAQNKTNFGGVLFIIYVLSCLAIFLYYLLDYLENSKFEIQYTYNYNLTLHEDLDAMLNNNSLNPVVSGKVLLIDNESHYLSDNFVILNEHSGYVRRNELYFEERVSDIDIRIYYKCSKSNCSLREEDLRHFYSLKFCNVPFLISHQNKYHPLYQDEHYLSCHDYEFSFETKIKKNLDWQVIKYIEKGGLFSKGKETIGGSIKSGDIFIYDKPDYAIIQFGQLFNIYMLLYEIKIRNDFDYYDEYIRTEVSTLTIFANSFSLWMSFFTGFTFIFDFLYATNFNNYKIIQNILSLGKIKSKELKDFNFYNDFNELEESKDIESKNNNIIIKEEYTSSNEKFIGNSVDENNQSEGDSLKLPKLHFFDYIFNSFYCNKRCCPNYKKQMLISTCNKIIYKYLSVESILYNQINLENLLKDYRWNNPRLKNIQNNELINKLVN